MRGSEAWLSATSTIDKTSFTISPQTTVKTAYAGDGNDLLFGNGNGDQLYGGRGNDVFYSGPGNNTLDGGPGFNVAIFPNDLLDNTYIRNGSGNAVVTPVGTDTLRNINVLAFRDTVMAVSSLTFREDTLRSGSSQAGATLGGSGITG